MGFKIPINLPIQKYEPKLNKEANKSSRQLAIEIYNYMASRPSYVRKSGSTYRSEENDRRYINIIEQSVLKGEPIEMFFLGYCSKYTNEDITNNQIYPDIGNLISFIHLLTISKNLSKIYPPGIKFDIALETDIYRSLGKHTPEETKKVNDILKQLLKEAEEITDVHGKIELIDTMQLVDDLGPQFKTALEEEKEKVLEEYQNGEIIEKIDEWIKFYKTTTSKDMFPNEQVANEYAMQQAIFYEAFNRIKYNQLEDSRFKKDGIAHQYIHALWATTRGQTKKATLQIFPKESHFPHHGITFIDKDGRWRIGKYSDLQNSEKSYYIPRTYDEHVEYPFYFEEVERELPEHDLNSLKCHTQILTMRDGEKVVLKFSTEKHEDGTMILEKEIDRIKEFRDKKIEMVPNVIFERKKDLDVAYATEYIEGETLEEILLKNPNLSIEDFNKILNDFLNTISSQMYDIGTTEKPKNYIKEIHGERIEDIKKTDTIDVKSINGTSVLSPTEMVEYLEENYENIENLITTGIIPVYSHGDLHFRNIIQEEDSKKFKTIDLNGRRPINTVETEMSRLLLSFDAYIIRNNLIRVEISEQGDATIVYSDEAKRILKLKEEALNAITENPNISKWFDSKKQAVAQIKLLEAVHVLGVHSKRKEEQQLSTYLLGNQLMNDAIDEIKVLEKDDKMESNDEIIENIIKQLKEDPENKETYKSVYKEFFKKLSKSYQDFAFISHNGTWYIRLTDNEGKRTVKCLPEDVIDGLNYEGTSDDIIEYNDEEFMQKWQKNNFPNNSPELITKTYSEKIFWESMFSGKEIEIGGQKYVISDIAGIGKESKAFITTSGEIIKVGQQSLKPEYEYGKKLESTSFSSKFPTYFGYDEEKNCAVMELCKGKTANELVKNAKSEDEKLAILRVIFDSIKTQCGLYNQYGIFTGQFNLRNIIIDDNTFKIIDPFYEGESTTYELKQLIRMTAILPQRLSNNDKEVGDFPLKVKRAKNEEELSNLRYPTAALEAFKKYELGLPKHLEQEVKDVVDNYLSGDITTKSMLDLENDMSYLYALTTIQKSKIENSKTGIVFDINGTIEYDGAFSEKTVQIINEIAARGVPIACITGKNRERAMEILSKMGIDMSKITLYTQNGAMCYDNEEIIYENTLPDTARNNAKMLLPLDQDILIREDSSRINVVITDDELAKKTIDRLMNLDDVEIVVSSNNHEIEILPKGINKAYALEDFAQRSYLPSEAIIRIGNEPYGNDKSILSNDKSYPSLIIDGQQQGDAVFEAINDSLTKGALQISEDISLDSDGKFMLRDFEYVSDKQLSDLSEYAQSVAKDFYPAFAIKQRLSEEDKKRLDYKWAICSKDKVIGYTFTYQTDEKGVYNVGMYMLPEYTGNGIGVKVMNEIFKYGERKIFGFKGIRERVAESNRPSKRLLEKCGFSLVDVKPGEYILYDSEGNAYNNNALFFEKRIGEEKNRIHSEEVQYE